MLTSATWTSSSVPLMRMGSEHPERSALQRTAWMLAVNTEKSAAWRSKSVYATQTCSPSPVFPTSNHSLSRKCPGEFPLPGAATAAGIRFGQQPGDAPPPHDLSVDAVVLYSPTPFGVGPKGA